jgi:hypothetical protein
MILWSWRLYLRCENNNHPLLEDPTLYLTGRYKAFILQEARDWGWSIGKKVLCPACNPRSKKVTNE